MNASPARLGVYADFPQSRADEPLAIPSRLADVVDAKPLADDLADARREAHHADGAAAPFATRGKLAPNRRS